MEIQKSLRLYYLTTGVIGHSMGHTEWQTADVTIESDWHLDLDRFRLCDCGAIAGKLLGMWYRVATKWHLEDVFRLRILLHSNVFESILET